MQSNITIITANQTHIAGIMNVEQLSWLDTYPNKEYGITFDDVKNRFNPLYIKNREIELLEDIETADGNIKLFVALDDETVVGYIRGCKGETYNDLIEIYVLPVYRGIGIGKQLINELFKFFGNQKSIILEVAAYNLKSITFYEHLGFKKDISLKQNEHETWNILPSGMTIPILFMKKLII